MMRRNGILCFIFAVACVGPAQAETGSPYPEVARGQFGPEYLEFKRKLLLLGSSPAAGAEATLLLREGLASTTIAAKDRQDMAVAWLNFVTRNATAWCSDPTSFTLPYYVEQVSFDDQQWSDVAVDANTWSNWIYVDQNEGKESCATWTVRSLGAGHETVFDLLPPPVPSAGYGLCGGNNLVPSLTKAWHQWNAEWDKFEQFHRGLAWVKVTPFMKREFDGDSWGYRRRAGPQLNLEVLNSSTIVLTWRGSRLLTATLPDVQLCPLQEADETQCNASVEEAYYSPGSLMVRYGDNYNIKEQVFAIANVNSPEPFVFCGAGPAAVVSPPRWLRNSASIPDEEWSTRGAILSIAPLNPPSAIAEMPDLTRLNAALAREMTLSKDIKKGRAVADPELALLDNILKQGVYEDAVDALSELPARQLPPRFRMLQLWLRYLRAPAGYKRELIEYDREMKLRIKEEQKDRREYARQEAQRKARETRVLASVPTEGAKCKRAIQDWHSSQEQIEKAAVGGRPDAVRAASVRRDGAASRVCKAAQALRAAIEVYRRQGLASAANAVAREHQMCIRSCP